MRRRVRVGASQLSAPPRAALCLHPRGEGGYTRELRYKTSSGELSAARTTEAAVITHSDDSSGVERYVATIGFQHGFGAVICPLPEVGEPSSGYWVFADELDVLWTQQTTGKRKEG
jgi:hypothetical protein